MFVQGWPSLTIFIAFFILIKILIVVKAQKKKISFKHMTSFQGSWLERILCVRWIRRATSLCSRRGLRTAGYGRAGAPEASALVHSAPEMRKLHRTVEKRKVKLDSA